MAEPPSTPSEGGSKSSFGFLTRKVGPAPVWLWGAAAFGVYYWYTHYGPGASKVTASQATPAGPTVIEVRGPRGPAGPPAPEDKDVRHRKHKRPPQRFRTAAPAAPAPVEAAAPMTASGIYGDAPVATPEGSFYDSGQPLEGQYVPTG